MSKPLQHWCRSTHQYLTCPARIFWAPRTLAPLESSSHRSDIQYLALHCPHHQVTDNEQQNTRLHSARWPGPQNLKCWCPSQDSGLFAWQLPQHHPHNEVYNGLGRLVRIQFGKHVACVICSATSVLLGDETKHPVHTFPKRLDNCIFCWSKRKKSSRVEQCKDK